MSDRAESSATACSGDADDADALQRCRTLVNTIDDGIYPLDAEDRFVAVNDGIAELTGYTREELLGNHVSALLDNEGVSAIEREIERLRTNSTDRSELLHLTVQTVEGEQVHCEVRVKMRCTTNWMRADLSEKSS